MKRLIILLGILLTVSSCDCGCFSFEDATPDEALLVSEKHLKVQGGLNEQGHMRTYKISIYKWKFEGHDYLEFVRENYYGRGLVHDPDCPNPEHNKTASSSNYTSNSYSDIFGGL